MQGKLPALLAEVHAVVVLIEAQARSRGSMDNGSDAGTTCVINTDTGTTGWREAKVPHSDDCTGCNNTLADAHTLLLV